MTTFLSFDQLFSNRNLTEFESLYLNKTVEHDSEFKEYEVPENVIQPYTNIGDSDCEDGFSSTIKTKGSTIYKKIAIVTAFGRYGNVPITLHILNFTNSFYVKIPKKYIESEEKIQEYYKAFRYLAFSKMEQKNIPQKHKDIHFKTEIVKKIDADGFTNNRYIPFIKLIFKNFTTYKKYRNYLMKGTSYLQPKPIEILGEPVKLYEGRCYPYMKFFHTTKLPPVGNWKVNKFANVPTKWKIARTPIEIVALLEDLSPGVQATSSDLNTIVSLAFDIETAPLVSGALHPVLSAYDPIIAMPLSFKVYEENSEKLLNYIPMYLGTKNEDPKKDGYTIIPCKTETELIETFSNLITYGPHFYDKSVSKYYTPDITLSYNGNGYDWNYIATRAQELELFEILSKSSKLIDFPSKLFKSNLSSSGLGKNELIFMKYPGIINIDIMQYIKKLNDVELPDIKLDTVARQYLSKKDKFSSKIDSAVELRKILDGEDLKTFSNSPNYGILNKILKIHGDIDNIKKIVDYQDKEKLNFIKLYKLIFDVINYKISSEESKYDLPYFTMYEYIAKAREMSKKNEDTSFYTTEIAKYSIQDCILLHKLDKVKMVTLATLTSANTNKITWKTTFICGSGVPIYSVVCEFANKKDKLLPDRYHDEKAYKELFQNAIKDQNSEWYEEYNEIKANNEGDKLEKKLEKLEEDFYKNGSISGGFVKEPIPGLHKNVATLDVNSEYPSIMRTHNLSFDTIIIDEDYDNIDGINYINHEWKTTDGVIHTSRFVCDYANHTTDGILPEVLEYQINARSRVRKEQKKYDSNSQEWAALEAEQLAIKILCNSTYGTMADLRGRLKCVAIGGCTTALSRAYIQECANIVPLHFKNVEVIYGDTDSFFVKFTHYDKDNKKLTDPAETLTLTWNLAKEAENFINTHMQKGKSFKHMKIELEKVFSTLVLYDKKKKYFGKMHEEPDIKKYKVKTMGVKHKKRDSSLIEKFIGSYIEELTIAEKYNKIFPFVNATIGSILRGDFEINYFKKSCKYNPPYKNPSGNMGYVIQDIVKTLDPGNQPQIGQRLFYVYCKFPENAGKSRYKIKKTEIAYPVDYITDQKVEYSIYIEHFIKNIEHILNLVDKIEEKDRLNKLKRDIRLL